MNQGPGSPSMLKRALIALVEVPAVIITFVMMLHVTYNAVMRTWFDAPQKNTLEIVQYFYMPMLLCSGFVAAQARGQHIAADLILRHLPLAARRVTLVVVDVVGAVMWLGFAWYTWKSAVHAMEIGATAALTGISSWPVYFVLPLGFGVLGIQLLVAALRAVRAQDEVFDVDPEEEAARDANVEIAEVQR